MKAIREKQSSNVAAQKTLNNKLKNAKSLRRAEKIILYGSITTHNL